MALGFGLSVRFVGAIACVLFSSSFVADARAEVTRIEIDRVESPTFEGVEFGAVGAYEKLVGRVIGEVGPEHRLNRGIVDIGNTPTNARDKVEYATDILILRPVDASRGNGRIFYELTNRGTILSLAVINQAPIRNDPTLAEDAGIGFLMREGYTLVFSGWDVTAPPGGGRFQTTVPIASREDGSPITGPALEEFVIDNATTISTRLTYPAASLNSEDATLTMRRRRADLPIEVPATEFAFADEQTLVLVPTTPGLPPAAGLPPEPSLPTEETPFEQGMLYELRYTARDPLIAGLGFAAVRDLGAFLKRGSPEVDDDPSALARSGDQLYGFGVSQPARFLRDFVALGFNEAEDGKPVFDGILNYIAGPSGGFFNFRFAQPARTHRQRIGRNYPEREFPFAYRPTFDDATRSFDGRNLACRLADTCPKIMDVNSSNEYWVKGGSLLHTDTRGRDLPDPRDVRHYLFSSFPHQSGDGNGICQQPRNDLSPGPGLRALLVALDEWVAEGVRPPTSRIPRRGDRTLVPSLPQRVAGFPRIPGVVYTGLKTTGDILIFGRRTRQGILDVLPPLRLDDIYSVRVPRTDRDGNEIPGIRFPDVEVPLATYTGWALRAPEFGGNDLCDQFGQRIPFAATLEERQLSGDPRLSIEERYPSNRVYVRRVQRAAERLERQRLLLDEDVQRFIDSARDSGVGGQPSSE